MDEAARVCAKGLEADFKKAVFWPPNPHPEYDRFAQLFHPSIAEVVDGEMFQANLEAMR